MLSMSLSSLDIGDGGLLLKDMHDISRFWFIMNIGAGLSSRLRGSRHDFQIVRL
jgi:hypothetical protein